MAQKDRVLNRLVPHDLVEIDGHLVIVPKGAAENATANKLLASQVRSLIKTQIKKYNDRDAMITPKELRDIVEAARGLAEFSGVVYMEGNGEEKSKPAEKGVTEAGADDIDLDSLTTKLTTPKEDGDRGSKEDPRVDKQRPLDGGGEPDSKAGGPDTPGREQAAGD